ncbi:MULTISPECIES: hypothetical protein [Paenibacillus]|uniref:Uncharacterized protein n=1 Tax=Paenibacillus taichungensis TaxID=484184 RepID=A0ABX2MIP5_9BACL|nr:MULTISPECIES: hypothetical protein [Paenibacillus]MCZ1268374.1 hypothetical protein [Paenibacillus tundrae]NUU53020.1 hypothetical protein [Paenibacillus taichungensis]SLK15859.1 hypothetical protein SAMN06272722_11021 [Paenibacillus sp. RU5A]SOC74098.1 hypothetical protein SAMN05880581_11021 [Paenibacillus sp. RU26A]SOC76264.1 hypothetical protein SAMN05880586_11021 [Paenibacillus sp. RU5M]
MINHKHVKAVFTQEGEQRTIFVSLSASNGEGIYLVAATYIKGQIVIAHECPAIQLKRTCWHSDVVLDIYRTVFKQHSELQDARVVYLNKKVVMKKEWIQIPMPKTYGVDNNEHNIQLLA